MLKIFFKANITTSPLNTKKKNMDPTFLRPKFAIYYSSNLANLPLAHLLCFRGFCKILAKKKKERTKLEMLEP